MSTVSKRGMLFRGATGQLWLLFEDDAAPRSVPQHVVEKVEKGLAPFAKAHSDDFIVTTVPDDVIQDLEAFFGISIMNAHFCNAPRLQL